MYFYQYDDAHDLSPASGKCCELQTSCVVDLHPVVPYALVLYTTIKTHMRATQPKCALIVIDFQKILCRASDYKCTTV